MSMRCNWPVKDGKPVKPEIGIRPVVRCGKGRTKQSFRDKVNINKIVARFERTGLIDVVGNRGGRYMDCSGLGDYHANLEKVVKAREAFQALPAGLRNRFNGDPGELLAFLRNPDNRDEAIKLGLVVDKAPEAPEDGASEEKAPVEGSEGESA